MFCPLRYTSSTIDESENQPERIWYMPPIYPPEAKKNEIDGYVVADIHIDFKGNVVAVEIIESSDPIFEHPFYIAAKQWKYAPSSLHRMKTIIRVVHYYTAEKRRTSS